MFILATMAFFAVAAAYVRLCDGIVGDDEPAPMVAVEADDVEQVAAR